MHAEHESVAPQQREDRFTQMLVGLVRNPKVRGVFRAVMSLFRWVPGLRKPLKALRSAGEIDELEREEKFELARSLRSRFLHESDDSRAAPLWRSEGNDRLYRLQDYRGALEA